MMSCAGMRAKAMSCPPACRGAVTNGAAVLVDQEHGNSAGLHGRGHFGNVVITNQPGSGACEGHKTPGAIAGQIGDLEPAHGSVGGLSNRGDVVHANDAGVDELQQGGSSLATGCLIGELEQHVVDGAYHLGVAVAPPFMTSLPRDLVSLSIQRAQRSR